MPHALKLKDARAAMVAGRVSHRRAMQAIVDDVITSVPPVPFAATCIATGIHSRDREAWLRARRRGLTGSEVAAILGWHPYKSALEVYADKLGAMPDDAAKGEAALWGQLFEPTIRDEYARRSGRRVIPSGELMQSRARQWWLVTPDGIQPEGDGMPSWAVGDGLVEVKTTGNGPSWHEEIPAYVQAQVQHQMLVTGALWNTIPWLPFPERALQWIDVAPHREFQAMLGEKCDAFWCRILERRPPDPDGSDSSRRALFALHPELVDEVIEFDAGAEAIADELEQINDGIRQLESRKDLINNRVLHVLGDAKAGILPTSERYFNSWIVPASDGRRGYRACRLMPKRKKPHPLPVATRTLTMNTSAEIIRLLEASLEMVRRGES